MNNIKQLRDQQRDAHPGFDSYIECQTRALFTGLSAFVLCNLLRFQYIYDLINLMLGMFRINNNTAFAGVYFTQKLLARRLPYSSGGFILASSAVACCVSYKVTKDRTDHCQAAWMAFENKHTALSESGRNATRN